MILFLMSVSITTSGTVQEDTPSSVGMHGIETDYPYEEGLVAGTTKQTGKAYLEEEGW